MQLLQRSLILSLAATAVTARNCGAPEPSVEFLAQSREFAIRAKADPEVVQMLVEATIVVPTYFHVVSSGDAQTDGNVPEQQLYDQLDVLNTDYAPAGISFHLLNITRTVNPVWATDGDEYAMKSALHAGDYDALNVYFQVFSDGLLGYAYFPQEDPGKNQVIADGVSILYSSVPGGGEANYDLGRTLTHEVGHWMGLYHTFQGGCSSTGDSIDDTPAERSPAYGCPVGRNTCTALPGDDPIHNFMDYTYDSCMYEFTPNQLTRMNQFYARMRLESKPGDDV